MKTIGIVAVTAEGAADCYKKIVQIAGKQLGVHKHPEIILVNPSFDTILQAQQQRNWPAVANILGAAAQKAATAGADLIIMPANSAHFAYDQIAKQVDVPVLNLVDIVVDTCKRRGYKKVAVLGVGLTMSDGLYDQPLARASIENMPLTTDEMDLLDRVIYQELVQGVVTADSTTRILAVCERLKRAGCEALVLACTELPLMLTSNNAPLPLIDSTELLAEATVRQAIERIDS